MNEEIRRELDYLRAQVERLSGAADVQEIVQLVMSYGPLVDAGSAEATANVWSAQGTYEVDGVLTMVGHEAISAMVLSDNHQRLINDGAGHLLTAPVVKVAGDTAVAFNHAVLVARTDAGYTVERLSANRWQFLRGAGGWEVTNRTNRPLDGNAGARQLFQDLTKK